jgi:hypothetical protein
VLVQADSCSVRDVHDRRFRPNGERTGTAAKLLLKAHPHMLRYACGCALDWRGTIPWHCKPTLDTATSSSRAELSPTQVRFWLSKLYWPYETHWNKGYLADVSQARNFIS